jgi:hypothetical protein
MAQLTATEKSLKARVRHALEEGLAVGGITAKVSTEAIKGTKLTRVMVTAPQFKSLRPSERQDLVWRIMGDTFQRDEQLRISMIMTLTPDELAGKW